MSFVQKQSTQSMKKKPLHPVAKTSAKTDQKRSNMKGLYMSFSALQTSESEARGDVKSRQFTCSSFSDEEPQRIECSPSSSPQQVSIYESIMLTSPDSLYAKMHLQQERSLSFSLQASRDMQVLKDYSHAADSIQDLDHDPDSFQVEFHCGSFGYNDFYNPA
eukprot:TRINITY_DN389_c0_g1_i2.p1 TRINITY_DN389_c0_g1~~TRINITY_DN389_c0_g1_i2.p1  ORF type:complete len:162 (-),score=29.79 TRINITY_DN389_c0_g1_i2:272-757(-)